MEFDRADASRTKWLDKGSPEKLKKIHIVDTLPDFHYDGGLRSMYMDVMRPKDDHRLLRSCKTGLLLRDNDTIQGPCSLSTGGITGAQVSPLYKFTNRGQYACQNLAKCWDDLEKSTPNVLIPECVNRPSTILESKDITGASPRPKNMKVGNEARDTNPIEPVYSLPSYVEPWVPLPKFVRDSIDVGDIEGARPSPRHKRLDRGNQLSVSDIEGTQPGWKPSYRRKFGKEVRNFCLEVEDISGPLEERAVRPSTSEVYQEIEGSHSKELTRTRSIGTPRDLNLNIDDIRGAHAGTGGWEDITRRRKEFAKNHTLDAKEQKDIQDSALKLLRTRMQDQIKLKQLSSKDVASTFELLDRQKSGKLDIHEVNRAFRTLRLDVCPSDLNAISKAFVHPNGDGYLDYWKLVQQMVPLLPKKHGSGLDSSNNVGRSVEQGMKPPGESKPCYDPARVSDLVGGVGSGNRFLPFNSGRPIAVPKYLKDPGSFQQATVGGDLEASNNATQSVEGSNWAKKVQFYRPIVVQSSYGGQSTTILNDAKQPETIQPPVSGKNSETSCAASPPYGSIDLNSHLAHDVFREVPVLSVLQEAEPQPAQVIKDVHFQEIVPGRATRARQRDECLFSTLKPPHEGPPIQSCTEPIFDRLKGLNKHDMNPLPIGGPFWPGYVEVLPENLAPPVPKVSGSAGPLPIGGSFWPGVAKPQPSPRASLRKDYPVPPLFSQVHSGVTLRKAGGHSQTTLSTWVDRLGDATNPLTFVGEGNQVISRSGMQGNYFIRPGSAYEFGPRSSQFGSGSQNATSLSQLVEERPRPQLVNSLVRGSPLEYPLPADSDTRLLSPRRRPSTAQSCKLNIPPESYLSPRPASARSLLGTRVNYQAECNDRDRSSRVHKMASSVKEKSFRAQLREDMDTVRLLRSPYHRRTQTGSSSSSVLSSSQML